MSSLGVARVGDTVSGTCSASGHLPNTSFTGTWAMGTPTALADGLGIVLVGYTGHASCGHTFRAKTGTSASNANGIALHRVTDQIDIVEGPGSGTTVSGSTDITAA